MRRTTTAVLGLVCIGSLVWMAGGCGAGILPTDTLAQAVGKIGIFNQLTVGDVVQGFQDFVSSVSQFRNGAGTQLTDDQRTQIEALQAQLDAGQITREDFQTKVHAIIGDAGQGFAFGGFGFFGGPFGASFNGQHADPLNLTDDQKTQAREIFTKAHDDIDQLRLDAQSKIYSLLTDDQKAKLAQFIQQGPLSAFLSGGANSAAPAANARVHGFGGGGFGGGLGGSGRSADRLARQLGITADQQKQIDQIRTDLRAAVKARHDLAREEFRTILTDEQRATLDQIEARRQQFIDRINQFRNGQGAAAPKG